MSQKKNRPTPKRPAKTAKRRPANQQAATQTKTTAKSAAKSAAQPAQAVKKTAPVPAEPKNRHEAKAMAHAIVAAATDRADRAVEDAMVDARALRAEFWATHGSAFGLTPDEAVKRHKTAKPAWKKFLRERKQLLTNAKQQRRKTVTEARLDAMAKKKDWKRKLKAAGTW